MGNESVGVRNHPLSISRTGLVPCLHDGSIAQSATRNAGTGVYCREFERSAPVRRMSTNFDGEVKAISMALAKIEDGNYNPPDSAFY